MYSNLVFLELSKPNIGLEKSFWLILITYPGKIITQTKKGYWNNIKELNFPTRKLKSIITEFAKTNLRQKY